MDWIDYRKLSSSSGGFNDLFLDYLSNFERVEAFYPSDCRNPASFRDTAAAVTQHQHDRRTLVSALEDQNTAFGSPQKTFDHIALLSKPSTLAVVTGQQVGLFGGPLYTIFKSITAIKLAYHLKSVLPAYDFVPVFWVESEDHDFAEVNHTSILDTESRTIRIEYLPGGEFPERNPGPVGEVVFDAFLEQTYARLKASLMKTEFTETVLTMVEACYRPGQTFTQGFTSWMNYLFHDYGLVFVSPNHPSLKRLLSPLFTKEIHEFPKTSQLVITQSAELERNYHAQIKTKSINLFLFHKGGRYLIEPRESDFSLKGTRHFLQKEELLGIAADRPGELSPNVVLRPLAQDILLPTIAYVGGPSEIAYHAQLQPVYKYLQVVQPVLYPRASASFVEERLRRAMEKYNLPLLEFFDNPAQLVTKVLEEISDVKVGKIFADAQKQIHEALSQLKFGLREIDPTLLGVLEGYSGKQVKGLEFLKEKAEEAQKRRNEAAVRQIEKASNAILPGGLLQERELNILYYLNKYGPDLMRWLFEEVGIRGFKHQILTL